MAGEVLISDSRYPDLLKQIPDPPQKLYYKGQWNSSVFARCVAVVGSRKISTYGTQITAQLVYDIAVAGVTVVSGFMYGVDAAAHKAALDAGGVTVAVMPCGIDVIHPEYQYRLYKKILDAGGIVLSEYPKDHPPMKWTYPARNRIVAGLSQATVVVEAALSSGSLITAELTKKFDRHLFAVPGPLTSPVSVGTSQIIKEGGFVATCADDVLKVYGVAALSGQCKEVPQLQGTEKKVVDVLLRGAVGIDELSRNVGVKVTEVSTVVSFMQLRGIIFEKEGKFYVS